jgi:hypothetical protein
MLHVTSDISEVNPLTAIPVHTYRTTLVTVHESTVVLSATVHSLRYCFTLIEEWRKGE